MKIFHKHFLNKDISLPMAHKALSTALAMGEKPEVSEITSLEKTKTVEHIKICDSTWQLAINSTLVGNGAKAPNPISKDTDTTIKSKLILSDKITDVEFHEDNDDTISLNRSSSMGIVLWEFLWKKVIIF